MMRLNFYFLWRLFLANNELIYLHLLIIAWLYQEGKNRNDLVFLVHHFLFFLFFDALRHFLIFFWIVLFVLFFLLLSLTNLTNDLLFAYNVSVNQIIPKSLWKIQIWSKEDILLLLFLFYRRIFRVRDILFYNLLIFHRLKFLQVPHLIYLFVDYFFLSHLYML